MSLKRIMQWAILAVCAAAAALNVVYLSGGCSRASASWGFALVAGCWAVHLLLCPRYAQESATPDTPLERWRGYLTGGFAALWLVTAGMTLFW